MAETEEAKTPAGRWKEQIAAAEKETREWRKRGRDVLKRYLDERSDMDKGARYNILWSNTEVMIPATYGATPEPIVKRRNDERDPVGRVSAEALERCVRYAISEYDFDGVMEHAVQDMLLPGLGVARVVYEPEYEERAGEDGKPYQAVASEKVCVEHVYWEDLLWGPARRWKNVPWVAFRWKLTRPELEKRFGKDKAKSLKLDWSPEKGSEADEALTPKDGESRRATGWEIWDRANKRVVWIAKSGEEILDEVDDPLKLRGFFPCPEPLIEGATTSRWLPQPSYVQYQDQARELDLITNKITVLTDGLKVVGLYAGEEKSNIANLLANAKNNTLVPVAGWAALQSKGGIAGLVEWWPVEQVVRVLAALYDARDRVKQDLYEITGISDIVRGATDPRETLGAQQIKGRFATLRMEKRQKRVAKFARDLIRLMAEVMAEMFDARTMIDMSGLDLPLTRAQAMISAQPKMLPAPVAAQPGAAAPAGGGAASSAPAAVPPQVPPLALPTSGPQGMPTPQAMPVPAAPPPSWEDVIELLRSDRLRSFRIDIETDSTIALNPQEEQGRRIEFLNAVGGFMAQVGPLVVNGTIPGEIAKEMMNFVVRGFRVGRNLEGVIDEIEPPQAPSGPSPEQAKMEFELKLDAQKAEHQAKLKEAELAHQAQIEQQRLGLERQRMVAETAVNREKAIAEAQTKREIALADQAAKSEIARMSIRAKAGLAPDDTAPRFAEMDQALAAMTAEFQAMLGRLNQAVVQVGQRVAQQGAVIEALTAEEKAPEGAATVAFEFDPAGRISGATFSDGRKAVIERKGGRPVAAQITPAA